MAIRKKGARQITVDGHPYLWRVRRREPEPDNRGWGWAFAVQHAEDTGSTLIVRLIRRHLSWDTTATPATPSEVANCIRRAVAEGWQPTAQGSPFHLVSEVGHPSEEDGRG
jgi:hypothetical protein